MPPLSFFRNTMPGGSLFSLMPNPAHTQHGLLAFVPDALLGLLHAGCVHWQAGIWRRIRLLLTQLESDPCTALALTTLHFPGRQWHCPELTSWLPAAECQLHANLCTCMPRLCIVDAQLGRCICVDLAPVLLGRQQRNDSPSSSCSMSRLWLMGFRQSSTMRMRLHVRAVLMTCVHQSS